MKVFQDVFTNDEYMSEIFPFTLDYDDVIMKVKSSYKNPDQIGTVDIGCGNAFGGNEEEGGAAEESGVQKVLDVLFNQNLVETSFSKADFMSFIKNYLKNLKAYLENNGQKDRCEAFQKGAQNFIKFLVSKFDEWTFYLGPSESMDGGIGLSFWEDESAPGPVFFFFKDGLKEVKY
jgi:hypothetical protein